MSLWLCLRFEQLPWQALRHAGNAGAGAVLHKQRVIAANDAAAALGITTGMGSATVRALADDCVLLERQPQAERDCLQQLCCWAYSITPSLLPYRDNCLLLEVGGCLKLFRGLPSLLTAVNEGLASRGFSACQGIAETPKGAWLLSHAEPDLALDTTLTLQQRLADLPLGLLEDFPRPVASLQRAGLHRFSQLLALPSAALRKRCGEDFSQFMAQALGTAAEPHTDFLPPASFNDAYWFGYEVKANQELLPAVQLLLQSLCNFLQQTHLDSGELRWELVGIDGKLRHFTVRSTVSSGDWQGWYRLCSLQLDTLQLETAVEGIALYCDTLRPCSRPSLDLFTSHQQKEPLGSLLDRLRNRLGLQAIARVGSREEHLPEYALQTHCEDGSPGTGQAEAEQRPFWLMPQPQLLRQQGEQLYWNGKLLLVCGPERIEDNWWRQPVSRDYFIARNSQGQDYWVYHDRLQRQWYVQGVFA